MDRNLIIHKLKEVAYIAIGWILITSFFLYIKFNDVPDNCLSEIYIPREYLSKKWLYKVSFFVTVPLGILLGMLHTFVYPRLRRKKIALTAIIRLLIFLLLSTLIYLVFLFLDRDSSLEVNQTDLITTYRKNVADTVFIYTLSTEYLLGLLILLRRNLGENYFFNVIKNTYSIPKEETRVFMFLDMENSTPCAEKMGHLNFSKYVQDCFWDLSEIVLKYNGEIYQFVGDEAVITWRVSANFDYQKCIDLYYAYTGFLNNRKQYYEVKYGISPAFRAALHSGKVSVAMVGNYKREIAYHGNVVNLCSRLQAACKENQADVLVSDNFHQHLDNTEIYTFHPVFLTLKGIENKQKAYIVSRN
ncbi:adenylate/guanylate cyclase domain-containing protein [Sphingobacterium lactis]|uniref:adenylate/guanylate cyclase domain-containing protein n=1 Tax=Sphingobacterium lactis TaxID=797291 RepID=UPI003EC8C436